MRKVFSCTTALLALTCASCTNSHLYPVSGKVTYKGAPASGAIVSLCRHGTDSANEPAIFGVVRDDGTFEVVCGALGKGAPTGDYDVLVEWTRGPRPGQRRVQTGPDKLKGRYADRKRPRLHATVEPRATTLAPFELADADAGRRK